MATMHEETNSFLNSSETDALTDMATNTTKSNTRDINREGSSVPNNITVPDKPFFFVLRLVKCQTAKAEMQGINKKNNRCNIKEIGRYCS